MMCLNILVFACDRLFMQRCDNCRALLDRFLDFSKKQAEYLLLVLICALCTSSSVRARVNV